MKQHAGETFLFVAVLTVLSLSIAWADTAQLGALPADSNANDSGAVGTEAQNPE